MVDPPCLQRPLSIRTLTDRATPIGSTPMWLRNLLSSTAIIAAAHRRWNVIVAQPLPEAGAERHEDSAIARADADHLAEVRSPGQLVVPRQGCHGDRDGDDQSKQAEHQRIDQILEYGGDAAAGAPVRR